MPLEARDVRFAFPRGAAVLGGVCASFEPGTFTAVVGPNGAGKTTLVRLLLGLLEPTEGAVLLDGRPVRRLPRQERAARLAYVPQDPHAAFGFTAREVAGFGTPGTAAHRDTVEAAMRAMGVHDLGDRRYDRLSAGQRQRCALARALAQLRSRRREGLAAYLVADEPTGALDPRATLDTVRTLRDAAAREDLGVVAVMHDLTLARRAADTVLLLDASGALRAAGPPAEALDPALLEAVFGAGFRVVGEGEHAAIIAVS